MVNILVIPLSKLTKIDAEINEAFMEQLLTQVPEFGKKAESHYIINNTLTVGNPSNLLFIKKFNLFLQFSRKKYNLIQITKD